jgi:thiol-disulfide isomerase/thioredoxin
MKPFLPILLTLTTAVVSPGLSRAQGDADLPRLPKPIIVAEKLAGKLVQLDGGELVDHKLDPERAIDYFLLFYSASWNPACVKFTPALIQFYNDQKAAGANFEIILVGADDSEDEMKAHMTDTKMPWPALRFADKGSEGLEFITQAAGRGVPCLAAMDSRGLILVHSYKRRKDYLGVEEPLKEFTKLLDEAMEKQKNKGGEAAEEGAK